MTVVGCSGHPRQPREHEHLPAQREEALGELVMSWDNDAEGYVEGRITLPYRRVLEPEPGLREGLNSVPGSPPIVKFKKQTF